MDVPDEAGDASVEAGDGGVYVGGGGGYYGDGGSGGEEDGGGAEANAGRVSRLVSVAESESGRREWRGRGLPGGATDDGDLLSEELVGVTAHFTLAA